MYTRQFDKWGWRKYKRGGNHERGTKTYIRSTKERSRLTMSSILVFTPRLFIQPSDNNMTSRESRTTTWISWFIRMWQAAFKDHELSSWDKILRRTISLITPIIPALIDDVYESVYGSQQKSCVRLEVTSARISNRCGLGISEAIAVCCLVIPCSLLVTTELKGTTPRDQCLTHRSTTVLGLHIQSPRRADREHPESAAISLPFTRNHV